MPDTNLRSFNRSAADLLRGDYKQSEHGGVILPFTVLTGQTKVGSEWMRTAS